MLELAIQLPAWLHSEFKISTLETYLLDGRKTDEGGIVTEDGAILIKSNFGIPGRETYVDMQRRDKGSASR